MGIRNLKPVTPSSRFASRSDFGDLTVAREFLGACNNATRGVWGGGSTGDGSSNENVIDYVTISTTSNASDFGDLTGPRFFVSAASGD